MNICVGIISYLPDDPEVRQKRLNKLNTLVTKCDELFKLPIIIIAQNWKNLDNISHLKNSTLIIYKYNNPLGITGARRALRNKFIGSQFDYLIMLDDDSELSGTEHGAKDYLDQIRNHPGMYGIFKSMLLKLFAISKEMYQLIDFPDLEAGRGEFFEDMYLIMALNKKYPQKKFTFNKTGQINESSNSSSDPLSTWYHRQYTKRQMGDRTRSMIRSL